MKQIKEKKKRKKKTETVTHEPMKQKSAHECAYNCKPFNWYKN